MKVKVPETVCSCTESDFDRQTVSTQKQEEELSEFQSEETVFNTQHFAECLHHNRKYKGRGRGHTEGGARSPPDGVTERRRVDSCCVH